MGVFLNLNFPVGFKSIVSGYFLKPRESLIFVVAVVSWKWPLSREHLRVRWPLFASALILMIGGWTVVRALYVESPVAAQATNNIPSQPSINEKLPSFVEAPLPEVTENTETLAETETAGESPVTTEFDPTEAELEKALPLVLSRFTVLAIDAGHGGIDPGSIGKGGLTEKDVTLRLAKKVRSLLASVDNLHVALTRYDDRTININSRNEIIKKTGADFVLSLHMNSIPQEQITLVESYYKTSRRADESRDDFFIKSSDNNIEISRSLATIIQDSVYETVKRHNEISVNAGLKTESMRILSQNEAPGALLEVTCLSNPDEEKRLMSDDYLDKLAYAIADGIKQFLETNLNAITASL